MDLGLRTDIIQPLVKKQKKSKEAPYAIALREKYVKDA